MISEETIGLSEIMIMAILIIIITNSMEGFKEIMVDTSLEATIITIISRIEEEMNQDNINLVWAHSIRLSSVQQLKVVCNVRKEIIAVMLTLKKN